MLSNDRIKEMDAFLSGRVKQAQAPAGDKLAEMDNFLAQAKSQKSSGIGNFAKAVVKPITDFGKYVGEAAYQGTRFVADPTFRKSVLGKELTPEESKYIANTPATRFLETKDVKDYGAIAKTGIKRTAGAASYAIPMGGSVGRMVAGGAVSGLLQGVSEGDDFDLKNMAIGAGLGAATPLAFKGIGKAGQLFKRGAKEASERVVLGGLGSPKSLKKVAGLNPNDSVYDLFNKYDLWDTMPKTAQNAVKQADDAYKAAIAGSKGSVKLGSVVKKFDDAIAILESQADQSESMTRQIKELMARRNRFIKSHSGFSTNADKLLTAKKAASADLTNPQFSPTASLAGKSRGTKQAFDVFKNTLGDVAPGTKNLGREEGALIELASIFENYQARGAGRQVLNFTKLGSTGVGALLGGLPGAMAGYVAEQAINSPAGIKIMAKSLNSLSKVEAKWLTDVLKKAAQTSAVSATSASIPFLEDREKKQTFQKPKKVTTFSNL